MASCHDPARYSQYEDSCAFTLIYPSPPVIVVITYVVHVTASHNKIILSYYHDYDCLHLINHLASPATVTLLWLHGFI